jgi:hypothetical protein
MLKDKLKAKVELTDRVTWVTRSVDRLKKLVLAYQANEFALPFLRQEAWVLLKRSWELWWHLRWIKTKK